MKIWFGRNRKGQWKASLTPDRLKKFDILMEGEVPAVHDNRLWMIKVYQGFSYGGGSIYDNAYVVQDVFHSVNSAKKSEQWQEKASLAKEEPKKYHVTDFSIASDDHGEPFVFGECEDGKFNMEIFPIRVIA